MRTLLYWAAAAALGESLHLGPEALEADGPAAAGGLTGPARTPASPLPPDAHATVLLVGDSLINQPFTKPTCDLVGRLVGYLPPEQGWRPEHFINGGSDGDTIAMVRLLSTFKLAAEPFAEPFLLQSASRSQGTD